jgi:hypothetical protein
MPTKRSVARRLADLEGDGEGDETFEIVITDHVVPSDWGDGKNEGDPEPVSRLRCWRDERGEYHSERVDLRDSPE